MKRWGTYWNEQIMMVILVCLLIFDGVFASSGRMMVSEIDIQSHRRNLLANGIGITPPMG